MRYEIKKIMTPASIFLVLICLLYHMINLSSLFSYERERIDAFLPYEGEMNNEWKQYITMEYEAYLRNPENIQEDTLPAISTASLEERTKPSFKRDALIAAHEMITFKEKIIKVMNQKIAQVPPAYIQPIQDSYASLLQHADQQTFSNNTSYLYASTEINRFLITLSFVIIALFSRTSTQENSAGTFELLESSRNGKKKLWIQKLKCNLLFTSLLWFLFVVVILTLIYCTIGFHGEDMTMINFFDNFCPYAIGSFQYLLIQLTFSYIATLVQCIMVTTISCYSKKDTLSFLLAVSLLWLPPILLNQTYPELLCYAIPNLMSARHILADFDGLVIGTTFLSRSQIACSVLLFCTMICFLLLKTKDSRTNFIDKKSSDE